MQCHLYFAIICFSMQYTVSKVSQLCVHQTTYIYILFHMLDISDYKFLFSRLEMQHTLLACFAHMKR